MSKYVLRRTQSEGPFSQIMGFKALKHVLKDHRLKRYVLGNKISNFKSLLHQTLSVPDFFQILDISQRSFRDVFNLAKTSLSKKFSKLFFET